MKTNFNHVNDYIGLDEISKPQSILIPIPKDFEEMDLENRIACIAKELKSLESEFDSDKGEFMRRTSLVKIADGNFVYSIDYVPIVDDEY